jgi:hypothetical protein
MSFIEEELRGEMTIARKVLEWRNLLKDLLTKGQSQT